MFFSAESVTSALLHILNTDTDVVVCFFFDSFFFLPVCFTDHNSSIILGKKAYDDKA